MNNRSLRRWRAKCSPVALLALATVGLSAGPAAAAYGAAATSQMSSGVVHWRGATWRADAVQHGDGDPVSVNVYLSSAGVWHLQGQVRLATSDAGPEAGDLGAAGDSLHAAGLSGASAPDFVMVTQAQTLSPWFSVISGAGGHWHLVPVDFGYRPLIGVPAKVKVEGRLLRVEVEGQNYSPSTTGWFGFQGGVFSPTNPPGPTPPCGTKDLGGLPASNGEGQVPPAHYACQDGWAVLTGTFEMSPYIQLMNWQGSSGWQVINTGGQLDDAPMWYGLPLTTLEGLGASVGGPVAPLAAAAAVVSRYAPAAVQGYGVELPVVADSGVVYQYSQDWLAVAASASIPSQASLNVTVYRWRAGSWTEQGTAGIRDFYGELDSSPGVSAVLPAALTGSPAPDFTINASGADTHWFAVASDIGGKWHGVPFDYGSKPTMAIDEAAISGSLVEAELDFCGCAIGPESQLWYQYSPARQEFLPWQPVDLLRTPVLNVHALSAVAAQYLVPHSVLAELATGLHIS